MLRKCYKSKKDRTICWPFRSRVEKRCKIRPDFTPFVQSFWNGVNNGVFLHRFSRAKALTCMSSVRWCGTADVANPRPREVGGACRRQVLAGARTQEMVGGPNGAQRSEFRRTAPHDNDDAVTGQWFIAMPHISVVGQAYMALTMLQGHLTCQRKPYIWWSGHTNMPQAHLPGHFAWLPAVFSSIRPRRVPTVGTTPRLPL